MKTGIGILLSIVFVLKGLPVGAQWSCAFDQMHADRMASDSNYRNEVIQLNKNIYDYSVGYYNQKIKSRTKANYVLPVVIHIVSPPGTLIGQGNNLTNLQVEQGLIYLNQAFANQGPYNTVLGVDVGIQFCLARRDPSGQPTNGITRDESPLVNDPMCQPGTNANSDGQIKMISNWDCTQYLNIWLVTDLFNANFGCSLAGYAYFPGAPCSVDGVVQESRYWNSAGGTAITAHEVGHYFSLNHTFNGGCTNNNCLLDGDQICDTPPDNSASFAPCNTNSCNTDSPDLPDDNSNYMDYTSCGPVHFTDGQRVRMIAALEMRRSGLIQSKGCLQVGDYDASVLDLSVSDFCKDTICPQVTIRNEGVKVFSSIFIDYSIDGIAQAGFLWNGNLTTNQSAKIAIPCFVTPPGKHKLLVTLGKPDNQTDFFLSNNTLSLDFETYPTISISLAKVTPTHCASDGTITLLTTGGTAPYTYKITNHSFTQTDPFFQLLLNGNYTITVTDTNFCQKSINVFVPDSCKTVGNDSFIVNKDARKLGNDCYLLTQALNDQSGSVWYPQKADLSKSFDVFFDMNLGCIDGFGADGIAFVLQPISTSIGVNGGGLGYQGVSPSLDVEFDTWQNGQFNDPAYDHVAIMRNGNVNHASADNLAGPVSILPFNLNAEDCNYHKVLIRWNAIAKTMEVYVDCFFKIRYTGDIVQSIFNGNPNMYFGFTASTGGAVNVQQICYNYVSTVNKLPNYSICKGEAIQVNAATKFSKYKWTPAKGINNPNIKNPVFQPDSTTMYFLEQTDLCGFKYLDSFTINVKQFALDYDLFLLDSCGSFSGAILKVLSNNFDTSFTYSIDGQRYNRENTFYIQKPGTYTLYAKTGNCIVSEIIKVTVYQHPLRDSIIRIQALNCKDSGRIVITALDGKPPYRYRINNGPWQKDGIFDKLLPGSYKIEIEDQTTCSLSNIVNVANFVNTILIKQDSSQLNLSCCNPNTFISVTATGSIPFYYYSLDNLSWSADGMFRNIFPGKHQIVARDEFGCVSDSLNFDVIDQMIVSKDTQRIKLCDGEFVQVGNDKYSATGIYVNQFANRYCCDSTIITELVVNPKFAINNSQEICQGENIVVGPNKYFSTGTYFDTLQSNQGCDSVVLTNLIVHPVYKSAQNLFICQGEQIQVANHVYTMNGDYIDTLQTIKGCDSIIKTHLTVHPVFQKNQNLTICQGGVIQISNHVYTLTGTYVDTLQTVNSCDSIINTHLVVNPVLTENQSHSLCKGQFIFVNNRKYSNTGIYKDTLINSVGCDSIIITQLFIDTVLGNIKVDPILCFQDDNGKITVNPLEGIPAFKYALNDTSAFSGNNIFDQLKPGNYTIYLKDSLTCSASYKVSLLQPMELLADLTSEIKIKLGDKVIFNPLLNFIPTKIEWIPITGLSCIDCLHPELQPLVNSEYEVIFTNEFNCETRAHVKIVVDNNTDIYIPNVFSPNGDQINDWLTVFSGESIQEVLVFNIYNRWGELVFQNQNFQVNDLIAGWNGTFKGDKVNPGVFVYYAKARRLDGTEVVKVGDVTLIR